MATWIPESASRSAEVQPRTFAGRQVLAALGAQPAAVAGIVMIATYALVALTAGILPLRDPLQLSSLRLAAPTLAGGALGLVSGYLGGLVDLAIGRVVEVFFAFPAILLALGIVAALGPDPRNVVIAIAVVSTPIFSRVV